MQQGVVIPGEIAFGGGSGSASCDAVADIDGGDENPAVGGDVFHNEPNRNRVHGAYTARRCDGTQLISRAVIRGCEPDFIAVGGPGQAAQVFPLFGQRLLAASEIDDGDGAASVGLRRMFQKRKLAALARKMDLAQPSVGLVEDLADGVFQTVAAVDDVNDGQASVRSPSGVADVAEHLAGRAAGKRNAVERGVEFREVLSLGREKCDLVRSGNGCDAASWDHR